MVVPARNFDEQDSQRAKLFQTYAPSSEHAEPVLHIRNGGEPSTGFEDMLRTVFVVTDSGERAKRSHQN